MVSLALVCLWLGEGSMLVVEIDDSCTVLHLKEQIKHQLFGDSDKAIAPDLQIFLAKGEDGRWLGDEADLVPQLMSGETPEDVQALIDGEEQTLPTETVRRWLQMNHLPLPSSDQIHVLVKVSAKRRRLENAESLVEVPHIDIQGAEYVTLPGEFVVKCGLYSGGDLMLYCRPQMHELWAFLRNEVIAKDTRGWIVGPPGTGKSVGMLSFAASLNPQEWDVVWIHISRMVPSCCVVTGSKQYCMIGDLATFELPRINDEKLFVCIDGFNEDVSKTAFLPKIGVRLRKDDRLVICSSMEPLRKRNQEDESRFRIKHFFLYSWTQEEYIEAIADPTFYEMIAAKLDATSDWEVNDNEDNGDDGQLSEEDKKMRALQRKFYYAGGSCRFMFQYSSQKVKTILRRGSFSASLAGLANYFAENEHPESVHQLYGMQLGDLLFESFPVSSFVISLFVDESRDDAIDKLTHRVNRSRNPLVDGPLLEWLFLTCVRRRAVKLFADKHRANVLPQASVLQFDPTKRFKKLSDGRISGNQSWLQPVVWERGSYDAVHFDSDTGLVIFVQLRSAGMIVSCVEIFFVMKSTQSMALKWGKIEDRGLLQESDESWLDPEESPVRVRTFEAAPAFWGD